MGAVTMQIGYARSSTIDQEAGYQAQIRVLKAAACEKVFSEKVSSVAHRSELEAALDYARNPHTTPPAPPPPNPKASIRYPIAGKLPDSL